MSILKGIMHHWNKTKNDYDIIHPETDYKQITDWNEGIVATLASTALGTLVNTLTSDSLLATMIQKVLTATGVKYNIAQNGYLCFGSLFGGLIIQWGTGNLNRVVSQAVNLPLSVNSILFAASSDVGSGAFSLGTQVEDRTLKVYQSADQNPGGVLALIGYRYIAICQG